MSFFIKGTGSALPVHTITNGDLAKLLDTSDEWISTRTGIRERRVITEETLTELAEEAARAAIEDSKTSPEEIDTVIVSTLRGDYLSPSMSCLIAKNLKIENPRTLDINMACPGFIYALDVADAYFKSGKSENILIVCAESMSRLVDWTDRSICVLFGDGAGAAVLKKGDSLKSIRLTSDGDLERINLPARSGFNLYKGVVKTDSYLYMNGKEIYKFAVASSIADINSVISMAGVTPDDISLYLLHQANLRIIESVRQKLEQPPEKFPSNIGNRGNTSSASIPILLDELNKSKKIKNGSLIVLSAFGAGLSTGACVFEWNK